MVRNPLQNFLQSSSNIENSLIGENHTLKKMIPQTNIDLNTNTGSDIKYKTELCKTWVEQNYCPYMEKCRFAHGKEDLQDKIIYGKNYKQKECKSFNCKSYCPYGPRCLFKHDERKLSEINRPYYYFLLEFFCQEKFSFNIKEIKTEISDKIKCSEEIFEEEFYLKELEIPKNDLYTPNLTVFKKMRHLDSLSYDSTDCDIDIENSDNTQNLTNNGIFQNLSPFSEHSDDRQKNFLKNYKDYNNNKNNNSHNISPNINNFSNSNNNIKNNSHSQINKNLNNDSKKLIYFNNNQTNNNYFNNDLMKKTYGTQNFTEFNIGNEQYTNNPYFNNPNNNNNFKPNCNENNKNLYISQLKNQQFKKIDYENMIENNSKKTILNFNCLENTNSQNEIMLQKNYFISEQNKKVEKLNSEIIFQNFTKITNNILNNKNVQNNGLNNIKEKEIFEEKNKNICNSSKNLNEFSKEEKKNFIKEKGKINPENDKLIYFNGNTLNHRVYSIY